LAILDQTAIGKMPDEVGFEPRISPKAFGLCYRYTTGTRIRDLDSQTSPSVQFPKCIRLTVKILVLQSRIRR